MKRAIISLIGIGLVGVVLASTIQWKSDLTFSHKFHVEEAEVECLACHAAAKTSQSGTDDLLPAMETCYSCHDEEDTECSTCHAQPDEPVILPRIEQYAAKFNHQKHVQQKGVTCITCHEGVAQKETVQSGMHLPKMATCMNCHETPETVAGCYSCHLIGDPLKPADHLSGWDKNHGLVSAEDPETCKSCHTDNYCITCHQGENVNGTAHPPQFIATHSLSYKMQETDCATCHESKQFCIDCHVNVSGARPADHNLPDWAATEHGKAAQADYDRCTVCHTGEELLCTQCHN